MRSQSREQMRASAWHLSVNHIGKQHTRARGTRGDTVCVCVCTCYQGCAGAGQTCPYLPIAHSCSICGLSEGSARMCRNGSCVLALTTWTLLTVVSWTTDRERCLTAPTLIDVLIINVKRSMDIYAGLKGLFYARKKYKLNLWRYC